MTSNLLAALKSQQGKGVTVTVHPLIEAGPSGSDEEMYLFTSFSVRRVSHEGILFSIPPLTALPHLPHLALCHRPLFLAVWTFGNCGILSRVQEHSSTPHARSDSTIVWKPVFRLHFC